MVEKKQKNNRRGSSIRWAHQFSKHAKHSNMLLKKFEVTYPKLAVLVDPNETPVNILCLDGGGLRGTQL